MARDAEILEPSGGDDSGHPEANLDRQPATVRRSILEVPAHDEKKIAKAMTLGADVVMLDLEDSIPPDNALKELGRTNVRDVLGHEPFAAREVWIRINWPGGEEHESDLALIQDVPVTTIVLPKIRSVSEARAAIDGVRESVTDRRVEFIVSAETALLTMSLPELLEAMPSIGGITVGGFDLTAELAPFQLLLQWGVYGDEYLLAIGAESEPISLSRRAVLVAARGCGRQAIDACMVTDQTQRESVLRAAVASKVRGFDGMAVFHPAAIEPVNLAFSPSVEEIEWSRGLVEAECAEEHRGKSAFWYRGHLALPQHRELAKRILALEHALKG